MFLVEDKVDGATYLVFTFRDPRKEGCEETVTEGVRLDYDAEAVHSWPDGQSRPEVCVGRNRSDPKQYKVFKYSSELQAEGYDPVPGTPLVFEFWLDYLRLHHANRLDEDIWYSELERFDKSSIARRQQASPLANPTATNPDAVADWLAKNHFLVDIGIREIWYLPQGSPPDEIRFLEINDQLAGSETTIEPVDFGLNVEGTPFRLLVADVTSDQFTQARQDPARLPAGWSLDHARSWRRRGA
jgi:hypothetical protein